MLFSNFLKKDTSIRELGFKVALVKCPDYESISLSKAIKGAVNFLGGFRRFVRPGETIFLKVNLLNASPPRKAVTTHPSFLRVVAEEVIKAGGKPVVGDSPGGRNTEDKVKEILEVTGIGEVCKNLEIPFVLVGQELVRVEVRGGARYRFLTLGREPLEAGGIISLPKLKTHGFMKITCAVKNLFGLVPGLKKAEYHLKISERMDFAHLLLDIYQAVKPRLHLVDAVISMEGKGPSAGTPRLTGYVLAGTNAIAVDWVASKICGLNPLDVYTNRAAVERGLISGGEVEVCGVLLEEATLSDFEPPPPDLFDKIPPTVRHSLRRFITPTPYLGYKGRCTKCGICERNCFSKAIRLDPYPTFDYKKCIRCYCCHELCPQNAIEIHTPFLARIFA